MRHERSTGSTSRSTLATGSAYWARTAAGKTTLVRALAGRVSLDGGRARLFGTELERAAPASEARRRMGIVPQEIAVYPTLTARENLEVFGALHGLRAHELRERVDWALEWTGLTDRSSERSETYSGGMKRRLNLACSVLHRPELLLLDEPTAGVDPQSRQRIWEMLDQLRRSGTTLVLTTHQLDEAQQVCRRIVIIDHGRRDRHWHARRARRTDDRYSAPSRADARPPVPAAGDGSELEGREPSTTPCTSGRTTSRAGWPSWEPISGRAALRSSTSTVQSPTLQSVFLHLTGREPARVSGARPTSTLLRIARLKLLRDRVALLMTFVLPIAFFSMFALTFGSVGGGGGLPEVEVVIVDEAETDASRPPGRGDRRRGELQGAGQGRRATGRRRGPGDRSRRGSRGGASDIGLVIPADFDIGLGAFGASADDGPAEGRDRPVRRRGRQPGRPPGRRRATPADRHETSAPDLMMRGGRGALHPLHRPAHRGAAAVVRRAPATARRAGSERRRSRQRRRGQRHRAGVGRGTSAASTRRASARSA